jgi:hypothetical protein
VVVADTVETVSGEIEPLLTPVTNVIAPVSEPILGVVVEGLSQLPVAPPLEMSALPAPVQAVNAGNIPLDDSAEVPIDEPGVAPVTRASFENPASVSRSRPAYAGPTLSPDQTTQPDSAQRQDVAGVPREKVGRSREPATSAGGPAAWLSAWLDMTERGSTPSVATISAILTGLIGLFIAPAIAAWVFVALRMPRSPYYLPVHPPD